MATPETTCKFELVKKKAGGSEYVLGKKDGRLNFYIHEDLIDSFSVGWLTSLTLEQFLKNACSLADAVSALNPK